MGPWGWILKPKPPVPTPPKSRFDLGDEIELLDTNPYKGALSVKKTYIVKKYMLGSTEHLIALEADNGTEGWFREKHFRLSVGKKTRLGAEEYEEAMAAREAMERAEK